MLRDRVFVFSAIGRTFRNIKGNFWWIWLVMVMMYFIVAILAALGNLPVTVLQQISMLQRVNYSGIDTINNMFSSPLYILLFAISLLWSNACQMMGDLMVGVSYYSFEEERTGAALLSMIDQIGQEEQNPNYNQ